MLEGSKNTEILGEISNRSSFPQDRAIALGVKPLSLDGDDEGVAYDQPRLVASDGPYIEHGSFRMEQSDLTSRYGPCWILLASK